MLQNIGPKHETTTFGSQFKSSDSNEQLHAIVTHVQYRKETQHV